MSTTILPFPKMPKRDNLDPDQLVIRAFYLAHDIATAGPTILPHRPDLNTLVTLVLRDWARTVAAYRRELGEEGPH